MIKKMFKKGSFLMLLLLVVMALTNLQSFADDTKYRIIREQNNVSPNKVWKFGFDLALDLKTVNTNNVFVNDEDGKKVNVKISYKQSQNYIEIIPVKPYSSGTYWIYMKNLKYANSKRPILSAKMKFTVNSSSSGAGTANSAQSKIRIGNSEGMVINLLGQPSRRDLSDYGFKWYIYNKDYSKYMQVGIQDGKVVGIYSNAVNIIDYKGIKLGTARKDVENLLGKPLKEIRSGNVIKCIGETDEYGIYLVDCMYITVFYDLYNDNTVTAVQLIDKKIEDAKKDFYGKPSEELGVSFEREVFDMANSIRVRMGKKPYIWDEKASKTARNHSRDMVKRNFFNHENPDGLSPFDRMEKSGIVFFSAAENIACGQTSAIFAHEGWMNSKGHRTNILGDCINLGVGVAFGGEYKIYYTQNFYTSLK